MRVFLSYRRADSQYVTDRIYERLAARFGKGEVFKDVDSIPLGIDFRRVIQDSVGRCDVLLAVIGPQWVGPPDMTGRRRIDSNTDLVRAELEAALQRGIPVVPVLVDGAKIPAADDLPPGLRDLAYRNGTVVRPDPDFDWDMERLTQALEKYAATRVTAAPAPSPAAPVRTTVLTIMGAKGGVGKSTIACRLAEMVAEKGQNVLLIDLDTGTAGLTTTIRKRVDVLGGLGASPDGRASVYDLLTVIANTGHVTPGTEAAVEVTPRHLAESPEQYGRVFLTPAVSGPIALGEATGRLLQRIGARRRRAGGVVAHILKTALTGLPLIDCVILDCGAEGSEFNQLVTEAHALASVSYVVVEPTDVCRESIHRIRHLLTRDPGSPSAEKLRVIVNRIIGSLDEASAADRFTGFRIAGFVPDEPQLFEDLQRGRVNHRYGYDSISRALHGMLKNDRDLPPALVPDEFGWVRPLARAVVELDVLGHEARTDGRARAWRWGLVSAAAVACLALAAWRFADSLSGGPDQTASPEENARWADERRRSQGSAVVSAVIGLGLLGWVAYQGTFWWPRTQLARRMREVVRSSDQPIDEIADLLIHFSRGGPADFALFKWIQDAVRAQRTARPGP